MSGTLPEDRQRDGCPVCGGPCTDERCQCDPADMATLARFERDLVEAEAEARAIGQRVINLRSLVGSLRGLVEAGSPADVNTQETAQ